MKKIIYMYLFPILFFSLFHNIYSQDSLEQTILIAIHSSNEAGDISKTIAEFINDNISLELKIEGYLVKILDRDVIDLQTATVEANAKYLVSSKYSNENNVLKLTMDLIRVKDNANIFTINSSSTIDLDLDSSIRDSILLLITELKKNIISNPPINDEIVEITDTAVQESQEIQDVKQEISVTQNANTIPEKLIAKERFRKFKISAGFSPFLTTGNASDYFTLGLLTEIHFEYRFQTSFGYFGLGIQSSVNYFTATGLLLSSENLLIAIGPEVRLGIDATSFLDLFIKLNGGVTIFMLNKNNEGYVSALIPYISGGLGIVMNITPAFGLYISGNYSVYFEKSLFITGFSPTLGLHLKL